MEKLIDLLIAVLFVWFGWQMLSGLWATHAPQQPRESKRIMTGSLCAWSQPLTLESFDWGLLTGSMSESVEPVCVASDFFDADGEQIPGGSLGICSFPSLIAPRIQRPRSSFRFVSGYWEKLQQPLVSGGPVISTAAPLACTRC